MPEQTQTTQAQPCSKDPAPQPKDPRTDCKDPAPPPKAPGLPKPPACESCCDCPAPPATTPSCLDDLIKAESMAVTMGERAKGFKTELEDVQKKVRAAQADYTQVAYEAMVKRWKALDCTINCKLKALDENLPCWWCVVECLVCPMLTSVGDMQFQLDGDKRYDAVNSLQDLRYWWQRERAKRQADFDRIKAVLAAWEKPATAIDKVLKDNEGLTDSKATPLNLFDLLFVVVPTHLAIAPPSDIAQTQIDRRFVNLCRCDTGGTADDCCGPDLARRSIRGQLTEPLPYLVAPAKFPEIVCCLASKRYQPAKEALAAAESELAAVETDIKRIEGEIAAKLKAIPADARALLAGPIDCSKYTRKPGTNDGKQDDDEKDDDADCGDPTPPPTPDPEPCPPRGGTQAQ